MTNVSVFAGIDVSKQQLDIALRPGRRYSVPNNEAGVANILADLKTVARNVDPSYHSAMRHIYPCARRKRGASAS
ncbi:MAG TPA: hypothetical protein VFU48_01370 [Nitrospira sp.]|nr:hypothetical protein [Nitrospira sp.]